MEVQNSSEPYLLLRDNTKVILNRPKFTMGRGINSSYIVEDIHVSRTHCLLEDTNGVWQVTDKSANGTFVNENRIPSAKPYLLSSGDKIKLSDEQEFVFINMGKNSLDDMNEFEMMEGVEIKSNDACDDIDKKFCLLPSTSAASNSSNDDEQACSGSNRNVDLHTIDERESNETVPNDHLSNVENELQCVICMELFIKATTLNCSHSFCKYCLNEWRKKNKTCPICRTKITTTTPTIVLDNFIGKVMESASDDVKKKREEIIKSREEVEPNKKRNKCSRASIPIEISSDEDSSSDDDDECNETYDSEDYIYFIDHVWCYSCGERGHYSTNCPYC